MTRCFFGDLDRAQQLRWDAITATDDSHAHVVGDTAICLGDEVAPKKTHQERHLARRTRPVIRGERVQSQHPNAAIGRCLHDLAHHARAGDVSGRPRPATSIRPAPIAIHDDRDVNTTLRRRQRRTDVRMFHCMVSVRQLVSAPAWRE